MGKMLQRIAGTTIGNILGTLLVATFTYFGLAPQKVVGFVIEGLPEWITPFGLRVTVLTFAAITLAILIWPFVKRSQDTERDKQGKEPEAPETTETNEGPWCISLIELLMEAAKQGWKFTADDSQHIFEFVRGLRDAGSVESIALWGREKQSTGALVEIDPKYWQACKIDWLPCLEHSDNGDAIGIAAVNSQTKTECDTKQCDLYADIHLDQKQAIRWLVNEAPKYRSETPERIELQPDTPIHKVFEYVENETDYFKSDGEFIEFQLANDIKDKAAQGKLTVWAKKTDRTKRSQGMPALTQMKQEDFNELNWLYHHLQKADDDYKRHAFLDLVEWAHMTFDERQVKRHWPARNEHGNR